MTVYETSVEQRQKLLDDGFVLLPGALPVELLQRWQDLAERLETRAIDAHGRQEQLPGACILETEVGPQLIRQDDLLALDHDLSLDLLSCPAMMEVARELCGSGVVPLELDMLYKQQHSQSAVLWHHGAPHPRGYPYLNVGIYLDDADAGDGCLRYVPGSQHELVDLSELSRSHGWNPPGMVEQPAKAGDILVQDMMVLHGSPPKRTEGRRRTIYVEYRPVAGIQESGVQSERWAELRQRWMGLVVRRASPGAWPKEWRDDVPSDLGTDEEEIEAIMECAESAIPAVYSQFPVETEDYPVPRELRP